MMTPKEKAEELVRKFAYEIREDEDKEGFIANVNVAKQCALIMVNELIEQQKGYNNGSFYPNFYWTDVKKEIELL